MVLSLESLPNRLRELIREMRHLNHYLSNVLELRRIFTLREWVMLKQLMEEEIFCFIFINAKTNFNHSVYFNSMHLWFFLVARISRFYSKCFQGAVRLRVFTMYTSIGGNPPHLSSYFSVKGLTFVHFLYL